MLVLVLVSRGSVLGAAMEDMARAPAVARVENFMLKLLVVVLRPSNCCRLRFDVIEGRKKERKRRNQREEIYILRCGSPTQQTH